jgi:hypothetical protein
MCLFLEWVRTIVYPRCAKPTAECVCGRGLDKYWTSTEAAAVNAPYVMLCCAEVEELRNCTVWLDVNQLRWSQPLSIPVTDMATTEVGEGHARDLERRCHVKTKVKCVDCKTQPVRGCAMLAYCDIG